MDDAFEIFDHAEFWAIIDASYTQDEYNALMWECKNAIALAEGFDLI